ncbi:hypothetical protein DMH17_05565 [Raoultella planticola]|nr:hypothetical protein [Raoultella planticola]
MRSNKTAAQATCFFMLSAPELLWRWLARPPHQPLDQINAAQKARRNWTLSHAQSRSISLSSDTSSVWNSLRSTELPRPRKTIGHPRHCSPAESPDQNGTIDQRLHEGMFTPSYFSKRPGD